MHVQETVREFYDNVQSMPKYKGIPMLCVEGLHEVVESTALDFISPGQKVLDVGCGRGALSLRLFDRGFEVDACDELDLCVPKKEVNFTCTTAEKLTLEAKYDCVFMVELLEHTEAPFQLLRRYAESVKPGGYLIITTPNVDSDISRAWFMLTGRHWYFEPHNVSGDGHITPIHDFQVDHQIQNELPFRLVKRFDTLENRQIRLGVLRMLLGAYKSYSWLRNRTANTGTVSVYVLRKDR